MKTAGQKPSRDGATGARFPQHGRDDRIDAAHETLPSRGPQWWLVVALVPVTIIIAICVHDATQWVGRPFAGFLFGDNRIVFSIGRSAWRIPSLRRPEWSEITAVNGATVTTPMAVHDAVSAAAVGDQLTYTLRRGDEVFRLAVPVREFSWSDFAEVFAPMLAVGVWIIAVGAATVVLRPALPEARALFAVCLSLGLVLITGPDQYGPYRFTSLFFLFIAALPPAVLHLATAFLWRLGRWGGRVVVGFYLLFAALGGALVVFRSEPALFLPLLYIVYCGLANTLLLYTGSLVSALVGGQRFRPQVLLALAAILGSAATGVAVLVTYPLRTEPVSVPWFIIPIGAWPVLTGLAFVKLERPFLERGTLS